MGYVQAMHIIFVSIEKHPQYSIEFNTENRQAGYNFRHPGMLCYIACLENQGITPQERRVPCVYRGREVIHIPVLDQHYL